MAPQLQQVERLVLDAAGEGGSAHRQLLQLAKQRLHGLALLGGLQEAEASTHSEGLRIVHSRWTRAGEERPPWPARKSTPHRLRAIRPGPCAAAEKEWIGAEYGTLNLDDSAHLFQTQQGQLLGQHLLVGQCTCRGRGDDQRLAYVLPHASNEPRNVMVPSIFLRAAAMLASSAVARSAGSMSGGGGSRVAARASSTAAKQRSKAV